jgi:cell division protein FtsL
MRDIYYVKRVENSRVAPLVEPLPTRRYFSIGILAGFGLAAAMFCAGQRFASVQEGYHLETLQQEKQQAVEENRKLRLEVASLGDPVRIDAIARQQLGMTNLSPHQIFPAESVAPVVSAMVKAHPPVSEVERLPSRRRTWPHWFRNSNSVPARWGSGTFRL